MSVFLDRSQLIAFGTVWQVLTRGDHLHGIKVRLHDGRIGRVHHRFMIQIEEQLMWHALTVLRCTYDLCALLRGKVHTSSNKL